MLSLPFEELPIEQMNDKNYGVSNFILRNETTGEFFRVPLAR